MPLIQLSTASDAIEGWDVCPIDEVTQYADPRFDNVSPPGILQCPKCHIEMTKSWNEYSVVCSKCQIVVPVDMEEHHTIGAGENHNTSNNAYLSFKPVGIKNRLYHNTMVKYLSEPDSYRDAQILQLLKQYNFINEDFKLPYDALKKACEMFITLRENNYVRRGKARRGVIGACLYIACVIQGITKTKSQIAKFMQVEESKITFGLEELQQYDKKGILDIPKNINPCSDFINSYFEILDLPQDKKTFVVDLVERMTKKKIESVMQCNNTTKCIGVIAFVSKHLGWGLQHEQISAACNNICRGTYLNVANTITHHGEKLRKTFTRHNIPLPKGW